MLYDVVGLDTISAHISGFLDMIAGLVLSPITFRVTGYLVFKGK